MYVLKTAAMMIGILLCAGACSSGLEVDAKPLAATSSFEAIFKAYDLEGEGVVSARELLRVEKTAGSTVIVDETTAQEAIESCDMSADGVLDQVEFTGLLEKNILVGLPRHK